MLNYSTVIGIVCAIFTSLFLGAEYSDGTIRNKIGVGHKRTEIYLSNFFITTLTSLFSYVVFIAVVVCVGMPLFGPTKMPITELLALIGCVFLAVIAYCGIFTFIAMIISNKAITAIVSLMLAFGLMMTALSCFSVLQEPQFVEAASVMDADTGIYEIQQEPNPRYLSGEKREIYQVLCDINPAGQMFQSAGGTAVHLEILPLYSLGIIIVFTVTGIVLFNRKEIH